MKGIFSVLVENKDGVLSGISGLFARRGYNIDSLAVGETERKDVSSMTIVSTGDQRTIDQIEKHLNKKVDVIKVRPKSLSDAVGPVDDCARIRSHAAGLCGWICWLASWGRHCVSLRSHAAGLAVGICRSDVA